MKRLTFTLVVLATLAGCATPRVPDYLPEYQYTLVSWKNSGSYGEPGSHGLTLHTVQRTPYACMVAWEYIESEFASGYFGLRVALLGLTRNANEYESRISYAINIQELRETGNAPALYADASYPVYRQYCAGTSSLLESIPVLHQLGADMRLILNPPHLRW